ncbi:10493_t:CDS:2, partial [Diversispora eburnea]
PGYVCELDMEVIIYSTSSAAINETCKKIFDVKTRFSGPTLGSSDQAEWNFAADFEITNTILGAWRSMIRYLEFWTCAEDPSSDHASILYLYTNNLLNSIPYNPLEAKIFVKNQDLQNKVDQFWNCFNTSIKMNKCGLDSKQRILSVIVNDFGCHGMQENLKISNDLMNAARKYSRTNGPGYKDNVSMSSYKVHSKTNLSILYLKDNKEALWKKYEVTYPDGIKQTSFMAQLENGQYIYRNDLGGLCSICNEYFYEVFDTLISLIRLNIANQEEKNKLIIELEKLCIN